MRKEDEKLQKKLAKLNESMVKHQLENSETVQELLERQVKVLREENKGLRQSNKSLRKNVDFLEEKLKKAKPVPTAHFTIDPDYFSDENVDTHRPENPKRIFPEKCFNCYQDLPDLITDRSYAIIADPHGWDLNTRLRKNQMAHLANTEF
ncbi:Oidioi.mRNA.OKI2018_I69.chr1.g3773.t1.cds [Oikopleura dioica]|uniref:Oidioi.mRNA.OKI2018_I69.chr1.g3773.t1.cds n=1 Tax=Oikopleura dioica TaxID=34765 RepID=A0ABN7T0P6_OIKDI|nr:Oidioi.mRNA.OKI2018_I69.chr1.g3773.t1.cds [Oikopleura dioica]